MKMLENAISNRGCKAVAGLAALVVLACAACATSEGPYSTSESVASAKRAEEPKETQGYTESKDVEIEAAKATVKRYWISANSTYEDMYDLFSSGYKEILSQLDGISNAKEFRNSIPPTERIWPKQSYQSARFDVNHEPPQIRIVVLADWEERGYTGVMTFIFDLVKEGGEWKITNIMF